MARRSMWSLPKRESMVRNTRLRRQRNTWCCKVQRLVEMKRNSLLFVVQSAPLWLFRKLVSCFSTVRSLTWPFLLLPLVLWGWRIDPPEAPCDLLEPHISRICAVKSNKQTAWKCRGNSWSHSGFLQAKISGHVLITRTTLMRLS